MVVRINGLSGLVVASLLVLPAGPAAAQLLPDKPVVIVVGFGVGGAMDLTARIVASKLSEQLHRPVVVENRPGAGGNLAAELVANAPPDGHTLYMGGYTNAVAPSMYTTLRYDPVKSLSAIARTVTTSSVLVASPSFPAKTVGELVAQARQRSSPITYSSAGIGSASHLAGALLASRAGVEMNHIPYKGSPQQIADVIGGQVDVTFVVLSQGLTHVKSGKVRPIALTSTVRNNRLPDLPTIAESGFPGYEQLQWYALFGPAGMAPATIDLLNRETVKALKSPDAAKQLEAQALDPAPSTPAELSELLKLEISRYAKIVRDAGIKPQ